MDEAKARARETLADIYQNYVDAREANIEYLGYYNELMGAIDLYEATFEETVYYMGGAKTGLRYEEKEA